MIDFRYHLVSLVSVFMALAIGVVLGAGPLKESLGDTLTSQVQALREDKEALQEAVDNRDDELAEQDELITGLGASLLPQQLEGRAVTLVTLPGAEQESIDPLLADLETAGAEITSTVAVQPGWTDPAEAAARSDLDDEVSRLLQPSEDGLAPEGGLDAALARAVLTSTTGGADRDATLTEVLDALVAGEVVTVSEESARRADLALVVAGPPSESVGADDTDWVQAANAAYLTLLARLDAEGSGTVLVAPRSSDADDGLLSQLRADPDLTEVVSSVDTLGSPGGRLSTVLALREQAEGRSGQYGSGESAQSAAPPFEAPATQETPGSQPTDGSGGGG